MNRRQFFGMSVAAVATAGLPALVLPEKTIFLPPRRGWWDSPLRMREVEQYIINNDSLAMRWDVLVSIGDGDHYQLTAHAEMDRRHPELSLHREIARQSMSDRLAKSEYARAKVVTHALKLPRSDLVYGAYV